MCVEILVPTVSLMVETAWVRVSTGVTHLARQSQECEPDIEGMEIVFVKEGTPVASSQSEIARRCIGPLDHSDRYSQSQTMISKAFTDILRSEPNLHDIAGACPWALALEKVMRKFPNIDPHTTAEEWLEKLKMGSNRVCLETCWHKHGDDTPVNIPAIEGRGCENAPKTCQF